jgi:hypothetical protein
MIYSKLEGTTSKQFKLGKNGIQFQLKTDDPNVLEIATPNGGLFTIGLGDVLNIEVGDQWYDVPNGKLYTYILSQGVKTWNDGESISTTPVNNPKEGDIWFDVSDGKLYFYDEPSESLKSKTIPTSEPVLVSGNSLPTAVQITEYVSTEVEKLLGEDFEDLSEALNSVSELVNAIGGDAAFFSNLLTKILGDDYYTQSDGRLSIISLDGEIPDYNNTGAVDSNGDPITGKNDKLDNATISKRLSILESQKSGKRLDALGSVNQTTTQYSLRGIDDENKLFRDNHLMYIYEDLGNGQVVQKKISLSELKKLRPGVYTESSGKEILDNDYVFEALE